MSLFFTSDNLKSSAADIGANKRLEFVSVQAWAGQAGEAEFFCVGNSGASDRSFSLYSSSPDIQLSTDGRWWAPAVDYSVKAGVVGDAVFVRCIASVDALEGSRTAHVHADDATLRVDYFLAEANEGDTERSQAYRFSGENTREIAEFFETDGEAIRIIEYEPQEKPLEPLKNPTSKLELDSRSVREWCNPGNRAVGFRAFQYWTRAFIGDRDELLNQVYDLGQLSFSFSDTNAILLPADFEGFTPSWRKTLVPFGIEEVGRSKYQGTVWTIWRDGHEYALRNIRRAGFFRGQILFWFADLVRVHYPGGTNESGFLPWNELIDVDWKPVGYVRSWSQAHVDIEDAYCDEYGWSDEYQPPEVGEEEEPLPPPVAPIPLSVDLEDITGGTRAVVTFDQSLQAGELETSNWTIRTGSIRLPATSAVAAGETATVESTASYGLADPSAPGVAFSPPPFDLMSANGQPVEAFTLNDLEVGVPL